MQLNNGSKKCVQNHKKKHSGAAENFTSKLHRLKIIWNQDIQTCCKNATYIIVRDITF